MIKEALVERRNYLIMQVRVQPPPSLGPGCPRVSLTLIHCFP